MTTKPTARKVTGRKPKPVTLDPVRYTAHRMARLVSDGAGGLFTDPAYPSPRMPDGSFIGIPAGMFGSFALYDEQKKAFVVRDGLPAILHAGRVQGIFRPHWEYYFVGTQAEVRQYIRTTTVKKFNLERVNAMLDGEDVT
jgi:hypothetical protein